MDSIIRETNTQSFPRLRFGVGRPPGKMSTANYVLEGFLPSESDLLEIMVKKSIEAVKTFLLDGIESAMNRYNGTKET
jgi:peptidyl-tRNA hydrolase, PTH1 family